MSYVNLIMNYQVNSKDMYRYVCEYLSIQAHWMDKGMN